MNHCPVVGRYTAISVIPSPSKSAGIGVSPTRPHWKLKKSPVPKPLCDCRMNHNPLDGRYTVISDFESASKSAGVVRGGVVMVSVSSVSNVEVDEPCHPAAAELR